ncbi:MAG: 1-acyl-sn-glycerol-3-phosphate acyltransferase [Bacteroidales bacterium]|nr:1-acyl-sn-glycerol-3-phosphate acyltransferase [Bacteroidales bacterium]
MDISKIEKKTFGYSFLRTWIVRFWHNKIYYKKIIVSNAENVPRNSHLIFTPNHQNALMDPLALISAVKTEPVFVARSDIFKKPLVAKFLILIKILPIYRIRDGYSSLKKNNEVFTKTIDIIENKNGLCVLPEGNHEGHRRLRPFKKGFARIAFQTEEANDFKMDIKIVPVGLDYSSYEKCRSVLFINFGKPLPVSDFYEIYKKNNVKGINALKDELSKHLKPLMVNIESVEFYSLYDELREIYKTHMCQRLSLPNSEQPYKLKADQELIRILEKYEKDHKDKMTGFQDTVLNYKSRLEKLNMDYELIQNGPPSIISLLFRSLMLLILSPVFIYGLIPNYLVYKIPLLVIKKIKDKQFHSSFKVIISIFVTTFLHIIFTLLFWIFTSSLKLTAIYYVSLPLSGMFAWWYHVQFKNLKMYWRYFSSKRRDNSLLQETISLYHTIIDNTNQIVDQYS